MIRKLNIVTLVIVMIFSLFTTEAFSLTLSEALERALEKNLDVLSAKEELIKAEGLMKVADGAFFPSLSVGTDYTKREETPVREDTELIGAELEMKQTIYAGGRLRAYKKQAAYNLAMARQTFFSTKEDIVFNVYSGFYLVLLGKENVLTQKEALAYAEGYFQELSRKRDVGLATGLQVTRAEQLLVSSRKDLVKAENEYEASRVRFFELLRIQEKKSDEIEGILDFSSVETDRKISISLALANRPDLEILRQEINMQRENIEIARSDLRPNINVSANWQFDDPASGTTGETDGDDTWSIKLRADFPIYDSGITKGRVEQETAGFRQTVNSLEKQKDKLRSEVRTILLELDTAEKTVRENMKNLELAAESLRLAEVGFREGVGIQLDVLDARRSLTQAKLSLSSAIADHKIKLAELRKAEGDLASWALQGNKIREESEG